MWYVPVYFESDKEDQDEAWEEVQELINSLPTHVQVRVSSVGEPEQEVL